MTHHLELFTHPGCISRIEGKGLIEAILKDFPGIAFREVDIAAEQKRARQAGVRMSPTLVLDGKIVAVGIPEIETLRMLLKERAYAQN